MNDLRTAAQQALEALETPIHEQSFMQKQNAITALKAALAEPVQEPVAGRAAFERHAERLGYSVDPDTREGREGGYWSSHTQLMWLTWQAALAEPDSDSPERRCGGPGCDMTCCQPVEEPQGCAHCNHPLYAAVKCRVCGRVTEPTPPQRKPLAEWQINDLMADIDPEDRDSWSFRQGVYAAEKHHGVRK